MHINNGENLLFIKPEHSGIPSQLRINIYDNNKNSVPRRENPGGQGTPFLPEDIYQLKPFESMCLAFDLNHIYELKFGRYTIEYAWDGKQIEKHEIEVIDAKPKAVVDLIGGAMRPKYYPNFAPQGGPKIETRLTHSSGLSASGTTLSVLSIDECVFDKNVIPLYLRYSVDKDIELSQVEMDCAWQVWTKLKSGKKQALLVWNLRQARVTEVLPWSEREIEMGTMAASYGLRGVKTVIAGLKGETKFSTSTVESWWEASLRSEKFK